nr:PfkB family carbohydrate kinase [Leucobacter exalbidus]
MPRPVRGLFVGLATLDIIHRVDTPPGANEKITALAQFVAAGGPAANAAVTFAALGGEATLLTALGAGTIADTIRSELRSVGVTVIDSAPELRDAAPVSSVAVIDATGDRSVIGGDASGVTAPDPDPDLVTKLLADADVVLLDGHHLALARALSAAAASRGIPSVLDAGRWKPIMPDLVTRVSDVVASADFLVPGTDSSEATATELLRRGSQLVVATAGAGPVRWWAKAHPGQEAPASGAVEVPSVRAVDTLAAGDVFHGAYAYALASRAGVAQRIGFASEIAAVRCSMVGPRSWLAAVSHIPLSLTRE